MRIEQQDDGTVKLVLDLPEDRQLLLRIHGWWLWTEVRQYREYDLAENRVIVPRVELIAPSSSVSAVQEIVSGCRQRQGYRHR